MTVIDQHIQQYVSVKSQNRNVLLLRNLSTENVNSVYISNCLSCLQEFYTFEDEQQEKWEMTVTVQHIHQYFSVKIQIYKILLLGYTATEIVNHIIVQTASAFRKNSIHFKSFVHIRLYLVHFLNAYQHRFHCDLVVKAMACETGGHEFNSGRVQQAKLATGMTHFSIMWQGINMAYPPYARFTMHGWAKTSNRKNVK